MDSYCKQPCSACPWRKDVKPGQFKPERFIALANTAYDMSMGVFACHKSNEDRPVYCAGFLLRGSAHNLTVRMALSRGDIKVGDVSDGEFPLHKNYRAMAVANGVPKNHPALRQCRSGY